MKKIMLTSLKVFSNKDYILYGFIEISRKANFRGKRVDQWLPWARHKTKIDYKYAQGSFGGGDRNTLKVGYGNNFTTLRMY